MLWLIIGIPLLLFGGDALVRGSAALARLLGVSPLIIGLTIVAFGTSAPELAVNLTAAISGDVGISFGNIIGSNIANIGLILGICAMIQPLSVHRTIIIREIPMMLLGTFAVVVMAVDAFWLGGNGVGGATEAAGGGPGGGAGGGALVEVFTRGDGLIMLLFFAVFMYYTLTAALSDREDSLTLLPGVEEVEEQTSISKRLAWILLLGGLVAVVAGGRLTVMGAVGVAEWLGAPQELIGLTVVAVGTSLPELATGLMAVRRGETDIAIGNVVGSNIFNLLLILAVTSIVQPLEIPAGGHVDLWMMMGLSLVLLPLAISGNQKIDRVEGTALLLLYLGYIGWRGVTGMGG
ncbi:MAG: calcium/sodium antiporter [Phycisphaeraceae bacterium]